MLLIGLFYLIVPLILIGTIAWQRQTSILAWLLHVIAFGLVISFLWATARWELVGIYFRTLIPILFFAAVIASYRRIRKPTTTNRIVIFLSMGINILLIVMMSVLNWLSYSGYAPPSESIELASPLRDAKYVVLHGGTRPLINAHAKIRPQDYALDIVGLNGWGMRANSIGGGPELEKYTIYGAPVYSPCAGTVLIVVDEFIDLQPPKRDTKNLAGNHVLIECEGVEVLLAHFKNGSIKVKVGDQVTVNDLIGEVGNTGNTSEPHLHIHAEKGGEPATILNGEAVPFTLDGRFLVRGDVLK